MINVYNEQNYAIDEGRLRDAVQTVLQRQGASTDSVASIIVTDDDSVAELNRTYRQINAPTDVLSFPMNIPAMPGETHDLGDLFIAYPYASAQAKRTGHDLHDSLVLLVVHGTLHLLGFDHDTPENRAQMWAIQGQILRTLHISEDIVPTLEAGDE